MPVGYSASASSAASSGSGNIFFGGVNTPPPMPTWREPSTQAAYIARDAREVGLRVGGGGALPWIVAGVAVVGGVVAFMRRKK